mgnify:CR=1 FL=1
MEEATKQLHLYLSSCASTGCASRCGFRPFRFRGGLLRAHPFGVRELRGGQRLTVATLTLVPFRLFGLRLRSVAVALVASRH